MTKQQVVILKVRYDDEQNNAPHTWDWTRIVGSNHETEVLNHGVAEDADSSSD